MDMSYMFTVRMPPSRLILLPRRCVVVVVVVVVIARALASTSPLTPYGRPTFAAL
jgi:hypothetical protein